jgi:hypothetical protein
VEYLPELMDLSRRLKLLKCLAVAHRLPKILQDDISHIVKSAGGLLEYRNDVAHGMSGLFGDFLTNPNAELTPAVQRRRSQRNPPINPPTTPEEIGSLNREWRHEISDILSWSETAQQLQRSTHQLGHRLDAHKRGESWEHLAVTRVVKPSGR